MATAAIEERIARMEGRVDSFEGRFDALEHGLHLLSARIDGVEHRLGTRIDALDQKVDRFREELSRRIDGNFRWATGINVALWSSILAALLFRA